MLRGIRRRKSADGGAGVFRKRRCHACPSPPFTRPQSRSPEIAPATHTLTELFMARQRVTPAERSGARKASPSIPESAGPAARAARLFAEMLALSMDDAALGIALGDLDSGTLAPLAVRNGSGLSKSRRRQRRHALESARFLLSPAASRLCQDLGTTSCDALVRSRCLAEEKAPRARILLEREAKARARAAAAEALRLARRDAATGIRILCESDAIPDEAESFRGEDLSGRTFGLLTVLRRGGLKGHMRLWEVRCRCGTVKQIARKMIGRVHSCGCALPEAAPSRLTLSPSPPD
ncbi:MAG: hypothetical protein EOP86_13945 [Verrucomicrobiaceae bacterium]|nr:MAG: hypothetical protein EOP86_13945 [Verrucomicrobiaceae bacterium]